MSVIHTSRIRIEKHDGPHRTAHVEGFPDPIHFGIHQSVKGCIDCTWDAEIKEE